MKRIFKLLILLGALAVLGAAYLLITLIINDREPDAPNSETTPDQIETSYTAARIDISSMYALKYNREGETYSFSLSLDETSWCWLDNKQLPLDNTYFAAMASSLKEVTAELKLKVTDSELAAYGLDAPWLSVTVSDNVYGTQSFSFGSLNAFMGQYYFLSSADANTVYLVSPDIPSCFGYTPYEMISNDTLPDIAEGSISAVHISSPTEDTLYSCHTDEGLDAWYVSQGGGAEQTVSTELAAQLSTLLSEDGARFVSPVGYSEDDRSSLGLSEPTTVTITYTETQTVTDQQSGTTTDIAIDAQLVLLLGYADGEGGVYAGLPDSVLCYLIDSTPWESLCTMVTKPN